MVRMRSPVRLRLKAPQKMAPFRGSFFYGKIEKTNRTIRKERMRSTVEEKQPQNRELQGARSKKTPAMRVVGKNLYQKITLLNRVEIFKPLSIGNGCKTHFLSLITYEIAKNGHFVCVRVRYIVIIRHFLSIDTIQEAHFCFLVWLTM